MFCFALIIADVFVSADEDGVFWVLLGVIPLTALHEPGRSAVSVHL